MAWNIFVEGIADKRLVEQLVDYLQIDNTDGSVCVTDGYNKLFSNVYINQMRRMTADGGHNIVIFDADADMNKRKQEIEEWKKENKLDFNLFLLPNDNINGDLEDLLIDMTNPANKPVLDCWQTYEEALKEVSIPWRKGTPLTIPAKKTKVYAYLEVLLGASKSEKKKIKEKNRNYLDSNYWNLNASFVGKLIHFLIINLKGFESIP